MFDAIGGRDSVYYEALYHLVDTMLQGDIDLKKRRCVILHGESNSGKSRLGKYMAEIFITHQKLEIKGGVFDEKINPEDTKV